MSTMKKHLFVNIDFQSTVKLTSSETREMKKWLDAASPVIEELVAKKVMASRPQSLSLSLLVCGDSRMRKINKEFRGKDKVTDVLSFPAHENLRKNMVKDSELFLGDIAISLPQAKRQAKEFKIGTFDEFIHLFFHGLLHLMGYDHEISGKEEKLMQKWEDLALEIFSKKKGSP